VSFYKIIGFPTGVGCLLLRRDRVDRLRRPWFSGGTVTIASVQGDGHYLRPDAGAFEDGTVDYLNLPAVGVGLGFLERIGRDALHRRVVCLTRWLLDALTGLRHGNGRRMVEIYGRPTARPGYDRLQRPTAGCRRSADRGLASRFTSRCARAASTRVPARWHGLGRTRWARFGRPGHVVSSCAAPPRDGRGPSAIRISVGGDELRRRLPLPVVSQASPTALPPRSDSRR
jgi:selenocysteine lyase/cysteine desulfurase